MIKFIPFRFCGFRSGGTPKSGQALLSCRRICAQEDVEQPGCDIKEHYDAAKSWSEDVSAPKFLGIFIFSAQGLFRLWRKENAFAFKQNSTTEILRVQQQARKKHKHALWYFV